MRLAALVAVLAAIGCRPGADDPPATPDAVTGNYRVATFNVKRLFDTVCESGACGFDEYEALLSPDELDARAIEIADAIRALDADVISLQEIETQACLDALLVHIGDLMPYGVLGEIGTTASVDVAVLSKTPIETVLRHRADEPLALADGTVTTFARELLEVHVRSPQGTEVVVVAAHFKSKSNDQPARRLAEARTAARILGDVSTASPSALVMLAGDLNDTPGSRPLDALTVEGGLIRVADDLAAGAQATYIYNGRGQAIDHILITPSGEARRVPQSSHAWRDGAKGWGGSDHFALTSDFVLP